MQEFLAKIRQPNPFNPAPAAPNAAADSEEWIALKDGTSEHAAWLNGDRIGRLLGNDLGGANVVLAPNQNISDLADSVVSQQGRFVAILDTDRSFRCLVDRSAELESLGKGFLKQASANKS
jgi:hypothetical protein